MRKLLLVFVLLDLFPLVNAYSFNFSVDNYKIIEKPTFAWADFGNTTFEWHDYELNTTDYLYWAGILVSTLGNCTLKNEVDIVDKDGKKLHVDYGTSSERELLYIPIFEADLYSSPYYNFSRGPYTFNITLRAENCEIVVKDFIFVTSKINPMKLPLKLIPPSWCPMKEPKIRAVEFSNKTYWREFELNFTYIYDGGFSDLVVGWKEEPCPVLSLNEDKVCLADHYCSCHEAKASLPPGTYKVSLSLKEGNLSVKIFKDKLVFKKSVHVKHPLYLESIGDLCSGKIVGNVSFHGVESSPSETFNTLKEDYGSFIFAVAVVVAFIVALRWRR
ncbi:MAG: hypothetical protein H0Z18_05630 [Thermococcus sp.]|uniref:hypothetical protein n=1 Tax=Thermococcus sp. TaxID=35749 RepID=UPI001D30F767|nr:hypothetical protein [Thermococcus sp.]MBO8174719.1 hypothetical protein [Thermococcus sp.]